MQERPQVLAKAGPVRGPQIALLTERLLAVLNKGLRQCSPSLSAGLPFALERQEQVQAPLLPRQERQALLTRPGLRLLPRLLRQCQGRCLRS